MYKPKIFWAQTGFGFFEDGTLRIPHQQIPSALRVIDDSILPPTGLARALAENLAGLCGDGCFLDFERSVQPFHTAFIAAMGALMRGKILLVPLRFLACAPAALPLISCYGVRNCWNTFVEQCQTRYPDGWALELSPWQERRTPPLSAPHTDFFLPHAMCQCRNDQGYVLYEDTPEGLRKKLLLAERHGCRLCIGLLEELKSLLPP